MKSIMTIALLLTLGGCAITADRYKVPTMTAWSNGESGQVYRCKDGYFRARDHRGIEWCDSTDRFDRYPLNQEPEICEGVLITDTHRPDQCIASLD